MIRLEGFLVFSCVSIDWAGAAQSVDEEVERSMQIGCRFLLLLLVVLALTFAIRRTGFHGR